MSDSVTPQEPLCVSVQEAAYLLGMSRSYVYQLLDAGVIAERRSGKRRLVILSSLQQYADAAVG